MTILGFAFAALLDIPIHKSRIQSLHVLFTLFSEFKNSQVHRKLLPEPCVIFLFIIIVIKLRCLVVTSIVWWSVVWWSVVWWRVNKSCFCCSISEAWRRKTNSTTLSRISCSLLTMTTVLFCSMCTSRTQMFPSQQLFSQMYTITTLWLQVMQSTVIACCYIRVTESYSSCYNERKDMDPTQFLLPRPKVNWNFTASRRPP